MVAQNIAPKQAYTTIQKARNKNNVMDSNVEETSESENLQVMDVEKNDEQENEENNLIEKWIRGPDEPYRERLYNGSCCKDGSVASYALMDADLSLEKALNGPDPEQMETLFDDTDQAMCMITISDIDVEEALNGPEKLQWQQA